MAKKRKEERSPKEVENQRNIAASPPVSELSQFLPTDSERVLKTKTGDVLPYEIVNHFDKVAWSYVKKKALFALSYTRRREILQNLESGPKGTTEILTLLKVRMSAPNVKGHLDVLVHTGLVCVNQLSYELTSVGSLVLGLMKDVKSGWLDEFSTEEGSVKRLEILGYLHVRGESKFDQIAEAVGINKSEVHRFLKSLVHAGLSEKGSARLDPYSITEEGQLLYERLRQLVEDLSSLYVSRIESEDSGVRFLLSPDKGFLKLGSNDLIVASGDHAFSIL
ncbi:MAG: ArsR family transcriptional regulator [Candidatus Thorarchaeota archaeon]|nr:ArsR family transcriptional regulator [Candidatus Thorarchaeota archaeon]